MNRPGWHEQNPRIESLHHAHIREQAEALERPCPVHRCRAAAGEPCINQETKKPYRGNVSHPQRVNGGAS